LNVLGIEVGAPLFSFVVGVFGGNTVGFKLPAELGLSFKVCDGTKFDSILVDDVG